MLPPGYEDGTSNFILAVGFANASGHEAAPAAAIEHLEGGQLKRYRFTMKSGLLLTVRRTAGSGHFCRSPRRRQR
jgi:hypothetical protein